MFTFISFIFLIIVDSGKTGSSVLRIISLFNVS